MTPNTEAGPPYENFSAGYTLVQGVTVRTWSDEVAAMPSDLYRVLVHEFGSPLIGYIGGRHYHLDYRRTGIPANTVAVPSANHGASDPEALLIQSS